MPESSADPAAPLIEARELAQGDGWRVRRVVCRAGPASPVAQEQHAWTSVSVVVAGSFTYRSHAGRALLAPGALLLGNGGACFECGHEHGTGDTCIAFQYSPQLTAQGFARLRGHHRARFPTHVVPPVQHTVPFTARAACLRDTSPAVETFALQLFDRALDLACADTTQRRVDASDEAWIATLLREISSAPQDVWSLDALATRTGWDRFRLLRGFKRVTGATPYQYVLRQRLELAARRLLQDRSPVLQVALACGFNDLSEFNRRFRAHFAATPTGFRAAHA